MSFGIVSEPVLPVRQGRSERGCLVNQALFGELYEVEEEEDRWLRVRLYHDGSCGWIHRKAHHEVDAGYAAAYVTGRHACVTSLLALVGREDEWKQQVIGGASLLPFLERGEAGDARDIAQGVARVGEVRYVLSSGSAGEVRREDIPRLALAYYNTPFLSGGRSPGGIDATGLVQNVYRQAGVYLPRDLKGQLGVGASCFFLEEALPGDLLFFGDESGVSHVGIAWEGDRVIHASGRVRVDRVDHHGIFNDQIKRYTHVLKAIKRLA